VILGEQSAQETLFLPVCKRFAVDDCLLSLIPMIRCIEVSP
jgi:hypothetical protein